MMARMTRRQVMIIAAVIMGLLVVGIILFLNAAENIFANITTADCRYGGTAFIWNDLNHNGEQETGEEPLSGVPVYVDDLANNRTKLASATSDAQGNATWDMFVAGCPETQFRVYIEAVPAYCSTTPQRLTEPPYRFGLVACGA